MVVNGNNINLDFDESLFKELTTPRMKSLIAEKKEEDKFFTVDIVVKGAVVGSCRVDIDWMKMRLTY